MAARKWSSSQADPFRDSLRRFRRPLDLFPQVFLALAGRLQLLLDGCAASASRSGASIVAASRSTSRVADAVAAG